MEIQHKGWDWDAVKSESWNEISEEFLPVALSWVRKYHSVLDIGTGKGRHAFFFAKNGFKASAIDLSESSICRIWICESGKQWWNTRRFQLCGKWSEESL